MFDFSYETNRVVDNDLSITYNVERVVENGIIWFKVFRKASKTYRYIDLTPSAAAIVMKNKSTKYRRTTRLCISSTQDIYLESLTSSITTSLNDNGSYDVNISVSEEDSTHSTTNPANPATLFAAENERDYDGGSSTSISTSAEMWLPNELCVNVTLSGELIGAPASALKLYYGGSEVVSGIARQQMTSTIYQIVVANWDTSHNRGKVSLYGIEADWHLS